jgi:hypothetical protein
MIELSNPPLNHRPYQIFEITRTEVEGMCANMFNLVDNEGTNSIVMSKQASKTFYDE